MGLLQFIQYQTILAVPAYSILYQNKKRNINLMFITFILPVLLILILFARLGDCTISKTLPPLDLQTHTYPVKVINDTNTHSFNYVFEQSHDGEITISPTDPLKSINKNCQFIAPTSQMELVSSHPSAWENTFGPLFYNQVYVPSKRLLYSLSFDLKITVYRYAQNGSLHQQGSMFLQNQTKRYTQLRPHMILSDDQNYLYVIVPLNYNLIWRINTNDLLSRVEGQIIEQFDFSKPVLKSISHNRYIYLVLDSKDSIEQVESQGLIIFKILGQGILELNNIITKVGNKPIFPVSLALEKKDNSLFVLDSIQNIYVFNVTEQIKLHDKIIFSNPQNKEIKVHKNRIYCSYYDKQFVIMELVYNLQNKTATLVRYFTSTQYISDFNIVEDLLLVLSFRNLQIYPANIDPRLIKKEHNGIHQTVTGDKMIKLENNQFLFIGKNEFKVCKLERKRAKIYCQAAAEAMSLNIIYNGISKKCEQSFDEEKIDFIHACKFSQTVQLQLPALEPPRWLQISLGIIFLIVLFAYVLFILIRRQYQINTLNYQINELKETEAKAPDGFQNEMNDRVQDIRGEQKQQTATQLKERRWKVREI